MRNIGIDFGTCNLKGAERKKNGDITYVKLGKSIDKPRIPNVILYENTEDGIITCIGDVASRKPGQDKIRSIKSHIQEKEWRRELSFGGTVTAYEATVDIMKALYNEVHNTNKNEDIAATITVPVNFSKRQRLVIENAAKKAGFIVNATITEPFASVFYLLNGSFDDGTDHDVLVFDFGGGTLDLCVVSLSHSKGKTKIETKATIGITYGGNDINKMILDKIVRKRSGDKLEKAIDKEVNIFHQAVNNYLVMEAINELKAELFEDDEIIDEDEGKSLMVRLSDRSAADFGKISVRDIYSLFDEDGFSERIPRLLNKLFEDCSLTPDEITDVFMTGGTSSIPYFRKILTDYFEKCGNPKVDDLFGLNDEIDRDDRIYSSVSMGAVIYSELIEDDDIVIKDKIPFLIYTKDAEGEKKTKLDRNSGCVSPYAPLLETIKQKGAISVYQTIYGENDKEVFLGDIELDDDITGYATLYKLSLDENKNIVVTFAYMMEGEEEPSDLDAKELLIRL